MGGGCGNQPARVRLAVCARGRETPQDSLHAHGPTRHSHPSSWCLVSARVTTSPAGHRAPFCEAGELNEGHLRAWPPM